MLPAIVTDEIFVFKVAIALPKTTARRPAKPKVK
jgi:hypothetical protein